MVHIRACAGGNYSTILMKFKFGLSSFNPHVLPRFQFPATIFTGVMSNTRYLKWIWFCACPVRCWVPISMKLIQILKTNIPDVSWKFGIILTNFIEVMPVFSILHLGMRRRKLSYDFDGFDMRPSVAQPACFLRIWTTFDYFYSNYGRLKAPTLNTSK